MNYREVKTTLNLSEPFLSEVGEFKQVPLNKETGWVLYMKRKNKFYFKSPFGKRSLELNPAPNELIEMKYGTKCEVSWE